GVPIVVVAASFQKDPQVLIAHKGAGNDTLPEMKGKPIMISAESKNNFWQFLRARYGFTDNQIRPYNYSIQPFLVNKQAIMQGYLTDEPFAIQIASGEKPRVILLADEGYEGYAQFIATTAKTIQTKPDLVQRFVDATMEGWQSYLHGDPTPAETAIRRDNPEMTEQLLKLARAAIIEEGMVDSGDAKTLGLGAMTDHRWDDFYTMMAKEGVYPANLDYKKAYTLRFIDHKAKP
ncbi:MAG TPA: ABC transporter substrate-binding protein, partial [Stellaceae bacterium]|nr:ABC transporter substrate-binding protein [Stellaceae bacterium]